MHSSDQDWPRCACGCGEPVPVRKASIPSKGLKIGDPCRFVAGHSNRPRIVRVVDGKKPCPKCETVKPIEDFNRDRSRASGFCPWCRDCDSVKSAEWYERNRERVLTDTKRYHAANPHVGRAAVDRWNIRHRDLHLARARISASAYRARKRGQFVEDVDAFAVFERDEGVCGICGGEVDRTDFHVDHIIPLVRGGEHSYANVQLAHPSCNCRKKDRLQEVLVHGNQS